MSLAKQATDLSTQAQSNNIAWSKVYAVSAAVIIGALIISTVGLAGSEILHNAAHDIRHGLAFPCH